MTEDYVSHLEDLRKRLIISLATFFCVSIVCYFFSGRLIDLLVAPLQKHESAVLIFQTPYEAFLTHIKVSAVVGFILSLPVIFWQFWLFLVPALSEKEKKSVAPIAFISAALFVAGAAFAYYLVIPVGLHFLLSFQTQTLKPFLSIGPYFSFLMGMVISFGLIFDFPVIVTGLVRLGILDTQALRAGRKIVIVGIFIVAAVLTPSPDPVSQLLLATPLLVLFEISLWIAGRMEKKSPFSRK